MQRLLSSLWSGIRQLELWMLAGIGLIGGALWAVALSSDLIDT